MMSWGNAWAAGYLARDSQKATVLGEKCVWSSVGGAAPSGGTKREDGGGGEKRKKHGNGGSGGLLDASPVVRLKKPLERKAAAGKVLVVKKKAKKGGKKNLRKGNVGPHGRGASGRLYDEPEFEDMLTCWEDQSNNHGPWSKGMHELLIKKVSATTQRDAKNSRL